MVTPGSMLATKTGEYHDLSETWCLWAHLPHDTDWSLKSYKNIYPSSIS